MKFLEKLQSMPDTFGRKAMPEVLAYNTQYRQENQKKMAYNSELNTYIIVKENVPTELHDKLDMEVYLSQKDLRQEKEEAYAQEMMAQGWLQLTKEVCQQAINEGKKIQVNASMSSDWLTQKIEKIYKPVMKDDYVYLMPARARRYGYPLHKFEHAFCKVV